MRRNETHTHKAYTEERNAKQPSKREKRAAASKQQRKAMAVPPAAVAAPPAPAAAGGAATDNAARGPACPAPTRVQIGTAAAAAVFALFAFTLKPATFPNCDTTATEIMELRFRAGLLLLSAMAQAGAATSLVLVPPSRAGRFLAFVANLLGLLTIFHLMRLLIKVLFATGVFCLAGNLRTAVLIVHALLASTFIWAVPVLWSNRQPQPQGRD